MRESERFLGLQFVFPQGGRGVPDSAWGECVGCKDVVEILHAEFCQPFSLTALAQRVGAHPVQLARAFRRCQRVTVGQYVRRLRVDYAMNALAGCDSLPDIAARAGFSDQSHLGRVFRAATGMTPGQFRLARPRSC